MENTQIEQSVNKEIKSNKKVYIINSILIIAIFIGISVYVINVEGMANIIELLKSVNYGWVLAGFVCLVAMWVCEAITVHFPLKNIYKDQSFWSTFRVTMIGQLFNNITPFASGGQIMQAYKLSNEGRKISDSLSVLMARFIITQTLLIIFTVIVVLSQFNFFMGIFKDMAWMGVIGIILNIIIVIMFFLAGAKKGFIITISRPIIKLFSKIHIGKKRLIKNPEETLENFKNSVGNFSNQFIKMKENKKTLAIMIVFGLLQSIFYYAITYMVYKAFGNSGTNFLQIITTQAFLMLIMTVFPTPGAGLGAEGGFLLLFQSIFQHGTINLSILFWRVYVFYIPIILGALFMIPSRKEIEYRKSKNE